MVQFSLKDEYNRGVREERQRIIGLIESVAPEEYLMCGTDTSRILVQMILEDSNESE